MEAKKTSRRKFIKNTVAVGGALALSSNWACSSKKAPTYNAHGLPTRILGKTGVEIPLIAFGTGSRFMAIKEEEKWAEMLEYAVNNGIYYWETGAIYQRKNSDDFAEIRLGKILKNRRKEIFLASKVSDRDPDEAKRTIERSLKRLQTDHIDLYQIHAIDSVEDVLKIGKKGGVLDVLQKYKEEGVFRFIGFTGHKSVEGMKMAAGREEFDTMLMAMNHWVQWGLPPQEHVIPVAASKNLGILTMKTIRPKDTNENLDGNFLIRYALGLEHVSASIVGMDSLEIVKKNIQLMKDYKPLTAMQNQQVEKSLEPFFNSKNLEWMKQGYIDGIYG